MATQTMPSFPSDVTSLSEVSAYMQDLIELNIRLGNVPQKYRDAVRDSVRTQGDSVQAYVAMVISNFNDVRSVIEDDPAFDSWCGKMQAVCAAFSAAYDSAAYRQEAETPTVIAAGTIQGILEDSADLSTEAQSTIKRTLKNPLFVGGLGLAALLMFRR